MSSRCSSTPNGAPIGALIAGAAEVPTAGEMARPEMEPEALALADPAGEAGLPLPVGPKVEISARTPGMCQFLHS